jgi:C4-dicarboxylate-specific signal transduction histidine kinase/CheY-like chemotaxis protein
VSLRAVVRLFFVLAAMTVAALGLYGTLRVIPRTRDVQHQTDQLRQLYQQMAANQQAINRAMERAHDAVATADRAALNRLHEALINSDLLVGVLPLASAPAAIRVPVARAADQSARLGAALEQVAAELELGHLMEARRLVVRAESLETQLVREMDGARARGLDGLADAQQRTHRLNRELMVVYAVWLVASILWSAAGVMMLEQRLMRPLLQLREGLRKVEEGDLSVTLPARYADEMGELTEHFNRMTRVLRDRAERQGQIAAAGELLAGAAHEVNNPLMAIAATAEARRGDGSLTAAARADLDDISAEAHRAGQLLRAIVTFLRPSHGRQTLEDFNELVRDTWELLWPQLRADGVLGKLDLAPDLPPVKGDRQRLQQMLVNLLSNAHHAVAQAHDGRIDLRTLQRGGQVVAEIRDNGDGIGPAVAGELFKPFFTTRGDGRAGLGLYTARMIARAAGGDVTYFPREGAGASFVVTLPAAPAPAAVARPGTDGAIKSLDGMRILVVDDEPTVRRPIARFLARRGALVREASDGREALNIVLEDELDLVLSDLRMPGMDGVSLYHALQQQHPAMAERVVFLSGDIAQLGDLGGAVSAGRVLTKPIELAELEQKLLDWRR